MGYCEPEEPDDPAMSRSVRSFLPVVEGDPAAPSAIALGLAAHALRRRLQHPGPASVGVTPAA